MELLPKLSIKKLFSNFQETLKGIGNEYESLVKKYLKLQQEIDDKNDIDTIKKTIHESYEQ